jgi:diguanylate cyclase (GGDEF)-like protein
MQISEKNKELERISKIDGLTHLFNRRAFDEIFDQQWSEAKNECSTLTILLVDVDFFKQFNDVYGHQAGDAALQKVANVLNKTALLYQGVAARYGGEEFILLFNRLSDEQGVEVSNLLLNAIIDLHIDHIGSDIQNQLTISIGCVSINANSIIEQNIQPKSVIKTADELLYQAKKEGRNQIRFKSI